MRSDSNVLGLFAVPVLRALLLCFAAVGSASAWADQGGVPAQIRALREQVQVLERQFQKLKERVNNGTVIAPAHVVDSNGEAVGPWLSGIGVALYRYESEKAPVRLVREPCDPCLPTGILVPYLGAPGEGLFFAGDNCTGSVFSEVSSTAISFGPAFVSPAVFDPVTRAPLYPARIMRLITTGGAETTAYSSRSYDYGACQAESGYRSGVYPVEVVGDLPFVPPFFIK